MSITTLQQSSSVLIRLKRLAQQCASVSEVSKSLTVFCSCDGCDFGEEETRRGGACSKLLLVNRAWGTGSGLPSC